MTVAEQPPSTVHDDEPAPQNIKHDIQHTLALIESSNYDAVTDIAKSNDFIILQSTQLSTEQLEELCRDGLTTATRPINNSFHAVILQKHNAVQTWLDLIEGSLQARFGRDAILGSANGDSADRGIHTVFGDQLDAETMRSHTTSSGKVSPSLEVTPTATEDNKKKKNKKKNKKKKKKAAAAAAAAAAASAAPNAPRSADQESNSDQQESARQSDDDEDEEDVLASPLTAEPKEDKEIQITQIKGTEPEAQTTTNDTSETKSVEVMSTKAQTAQDPVVSPSDDKVPTAAIDQNHTGDTTLTAADSKLGDSTSNSMATDPTNEKMQGNTDPNLHDNNDTDCIKDNELPADPITETSTTNSSSVPTGPEKDITPAPAAIETAIDSKETQALAGSTESKELVHIESTPLPTETTEIEPSVTNNTVPEWTESTLNSKEALTNVDEGSVELKEVLAEPEKVSAEPKNVSKESEKVSAEPENVSTESEKMSAELEKVQTESEKVSVPSNIEVLAETGSNPTKVNGVEKASTDDNQAVLDTAEDSKITEKTPANDENTVEHSEKVHLINGNVEIAPKSVDEVKDSIVSVEEVPIKPYLAENAKGTARETDSQAPNTKPKQEKAKEPVTKSGSVANAVKSMAKAFENVGGQYTRPKPVDVANVNIDNPNGEDRQKVNVLKKSAEDKKAVATIGHNKSFEEKVETTKLDQNQGEKTSAEEKGASKDIEKKKDSKPTVTSPTKEAGDSKSLDSTATVSKAKDEKKDEDVKSKNGAAIKDTLKKTLSDAKTVKYGAKDAGKPALEKKSSVAQRIETLQTPVKSEIESKKLKQVKPVKKPVNEEQDVSGKKSPVTKSKRMPTLVAKSKKDDAEANSNKSGIRSPNTQGKSLGPAKKVTSAAPIEESAPEKKTRLTPRVPRVALLTKKPQVSKEEPTIEEADKPKKRLSRATLSRLTAQTVASANKHASTSGQPVDPVSTTAPVQRSARRTSAVGPVTVKVDASAAKKLLSSTRNAAIETPVAKDGNTQDVTEKHQLKKQTPTSRSGIQFPLGSGNGKAKASVQATLTTTDGAIPKTSVNMPTTQAPAAQATSGTTTFDTNESYGMVASKDEPVLHDTPTIQAPVQQPNNAQDGKQRIEHGQSPPSSSVSSSRPDTPERHNTSKPSSEKSSTANVKSLVDRLTD